MLGGLWVLGSPRGRRPLLVGAVLVAATATLLLAGPAVGVVDSAAAQGTDDPGPTARIWWTPLQPEAGESVTLNGSYSYDEGGQIVEYKWDLDGDFEEVPPSQAFDATGPVVEWTYNGSDRIEVTLVVVDDADQEALDGVIFSPDMEVGTYPRIVVKAEPRRGKVGTTFAVDASRSMPPPGVQSIVKYEFRGLGTVLFEEDADGVIEKSLNQPGQYQYWMRVTDSNGTKAQETGYFNVFVEPGNIPGQISKMLSPAGQAAGVALALLVAAAAADRRDR